MAQMNISLPDALKEWVEAQVATGRYATASDYMRDLVRQHQSAQQKLAHLQDIIDHGRASGESSMTMADLKKELSTTVEHA